MSGEYNYWAVVNNPSPIRPVPAAGRDVDRDDDSEGIAARIMAAQGSWPGSRRDPDAPRRPEDVAAEARAAIDAALDEDGDVEYLYADDGVADALLARHEELLARSESGSRHIAAVAKSINPWRGS